MKFFKFLFTLIISSSLFCENLTVEDLFSPDDMQKTGIGNLTDEQKKALVGWTLDWTRKVLQEAHTYRRGESIADWIHKWPQYLSPQSKGQEAKRVEQKQLLNCRIDKNRDNGALLELRDGSVWKIAEVDRYLTRVWSRDDQLSWTKDPYDIAFPYRLKNETREQVVYAIMQKSPAPSFEKEAENPILYKGAVPISNITIVKTKSTNVRKVYPTDVFFELADGTSWSVAPVDMVRCEDWRQGDRIQVKKTQDPLYQYRLTNVDTGEEIVANMKKS